MPSIRGHKSKKKCRRHTRDLDQLHRDLQNPEHLSRFHDETKTPAEELPGMGEFYCVECSIWFPSAANQESHTKSKRHKRRVRALRDEPHSQRECENAIGISVDNGRGVEPILILKMAKPERSAPVVDSAMI